MQISQRKTLFLTRHRSEAAILWHGKEIVQLNWKKLLQRFSLKSSIYLILFSRFSKAWSKMFANFLGWSFPEIYVWLCSMNFIWSNLRNETLNNFAKHLKIYAKKLHCYYLITIMYLHSVYAYFQWFAVRTKPNSLTIKSHILCDFWNPLMRQTSKWLPALKSMNKTLYN